MFNPSDYYFAYIRSLDSCLARTFVVVSKKYWEDKHHLDSDFNKDLNELLMENGFREAAEGAYSYIGLNKEYLYPENKEKGRKEGLKKMVQMGFVENKEISKYIG